LALRRSAAYEHFDGRYEDSAGTAPIALGGNACRFELDAVRVPLSLNSEIEERPGLKHLLGV
jgi:hypothetical protein